VTSRLGTGKSLAFYTVQHVSIGRIYVAVTLHRENKDHEKGKPCDVIAARQGGQIRRQHKKRKCHLHTKRGHFFMNAPNAVSTMFVFCFQKCASCTNAQDLCVPQVSPASHKKFIMILYTVFIIPMA
jgi:hypothetical protein